MQHTRLELIALLHRVTTELSKVRDQVAKYGTSYDLDKAVQHLESAQVQVKLQKG